MLQSVFKSEHNQESHLRFNYLGSQVGERKISTFLTSLTNRFQIKSQTCTISLKVSYKIIVHL